MNHQGDNIIAFCFYILCNNEQYLRNEESQKAVDIYTPQQRSKLMAKIHGKNTTPELVVRKLAYGLGFRYRLHYKNLPGKPDLVFPGKKKVIFVHGCFWHRHDCPKGQQLPKSRTDFWLPKLARNKERDREVQDKLASLGWEVLVIWDCQIKKSDVLIKKLKDFLK